MKIDLGVRPRWTIAGLLWLAMGIYCLVDIYLNVDTTPFWFALCGPLIFGIGGGILLAQWHDTRKLRRAAREWADAHPGEDPEDELIEHQLEEVRRNQSRRERERRAQIPPEDNPYWTTYTQRWLGKPENPTDDPGGMGDHD